MKLIRGFFWAVFAVAIYDVAACMLTQCNPLSSLVIGMIAASSAVLVDWLESWHAERTWDLDQRRAEARMDTFARWDRDEYTA
jgi:hypothetical protein